jgi:para-aminobenzoate synthetase component I
MSNSLTSLLPAWSGAASLQRPKSNETKDQVGLSAFDERPMSMEAGRTANGLESWLARFPPGASSLPAEVEPLRTRRTPLELFGAVSDRPDAFLLDSSLDISGQGRFTYLGCEPAAILRCWGDACQFSAGAERLEWRGDPFEAIDYALAAFQSTPPPGAPSFVGGAVGYFAYDLSEHLHPLPHRTPADLRAPDLWLGLYDAVVAYDHELGQTYLCSTGYPERDPNNCRRWARQRLHWLRNLFGPVDTQTVSEPGRLLGLSANFTHKGYLEAVDRALALIAARELEQVNLVQRFATPYTGDAYPLYLRLRESYPAPFGAFFRFDDGALLSASPERFLRVDGRCVRTRPLSGNRPRGGTPEQDRQLARDLWGSAEERAALRSIANLARSDLERVCEPGTIDPANPAELEAHPSGFHLVATIQGRLRAAASATDCLRACFPGSSSAGSPRNRAMTLIEELEPSRRGPSTGAIGYIGWNGQADLSLASRTMLQAEGRLIFHSGVRIVAESVPEMVCQESLDAAHGMLRALQGVRG